MPLSACTMASFCPIVAYPNPAVTSAISCKHSLFLDSVSHFSDPLTEILNKRIAYTAVSLTIKSHPTGKHFLLRLPRGVALFSCWGPIQTRKAQMSPVEQSHPWGSREENPPAPKRERVEQACQVNSAHICQPEQLMSPRRQSEQRGPDFST